VDDPLNEANKGLTAVGELLKIAGDNPDARAAAAQIGKSALTITKAINVALLPLAAVNYAYDKAHKYFSTKFEADISKKLNQVPEGHLVEPKASVVGPALQGLAFSHEEPTLKDMYLSLIASATDGRVAATAHPAFVEIIKQLTAEEARLFQALLSDSGGIPIVEIRKEVTDDGSWDVMLRHLLDFRSETGAEPEERAGMAAIVDNWIRLGLVNVRYDLHVGGEGVYGWVEKRPEMMVLRASEGPAKIFYQEGALFVTALGWQFAAACGLVDRQNHIGDFPTLKQETPNISPGRDVRYYSESAGTLPEPKPNIKFREPDAVHIELITWTLRPDHLRAPTSWTAPFHKVRFINDPMVPAPSAVAKNVSAKVRFSQEGQLLREVDGRWSESESPLERMAKGQPILDLIKMDFGIGDERNLDIAFKRTESEDAFIFCNDSYHFAPMFERPDFRLSPGTYEVTVRLRGSHVDTTFEWSFLNPGAGKDLTIVVVKPQAP